MQLLFAGGNTARNQRAKECECEKNNQVQLVMSIPPGDFAMKFYRKNYDSDLERIANLVLGTLADLKKQAKNMK